jgi:CubicO group peptidase (beta-lactamase class C family)
MGGTTPHIVFCASKSNCGTLGGILVYRGLLDPDDPVIDCIPELASSVYAGGTTSMNFRACSIADSSSAATNARDRRQCPSRPTT